ncbi:pnFL-2 [Iris pallida]|uniref:Protein TIFY n=1 Tax=Iris pallida TaxID=29817 RepID=A0AAX6F008_IRIPA|nr:pnFL-2 [Iris pallida]KAJ6809488.1 pnFL-2 [Iris pallida]
MANTSARSSNFAVTCSLLSQYMKEKGTRSLADLSFSPLAGKADTYRPPPTMSLLPGADVSTEDDISAPMELFPQRAGLGLNVPAADTRKPEKAPLTIFYGGKVLVFDDFPSDKASDLMQLACRKSGTDDSLVLAPPAAAATAVTVAAEAKNATSGQNLTFVSSPTNSLPPVVKSQPQKPTQVTVSNLPMARKASLHRFLEKRNDRINAKAPYQVKDSSKDAPAGSAKAAERQPWLRLKPSLSSERS